MDNTWDDLIFSETCEHWLKVARIIGRVSDRAPNGPHFEEIAARIQALVNEGKLEAQGDLSRCAKVKSVSPNRAQLRALHRRHNRPPA